MITSSNFVGLLEQGSLACAVARWDGLSGQAKRPREGAKNGEMPRASGWPHVAARVSLQRLRQGGRDGYD